MELFVLQNTLYIMYVAGLSSEAGCRRNSTSTLYSAAGYFLCIEDKKCVIYSQSHYRDNDHVFFFHYQSLIIVTTIDLSIVNNASQKSRRFSLASESLVALYGMNKLIKHHKMLKRILSFPDQSSITKWLIKENKCIF
jgi:hypothetical protein